MTTTQKDTHPQPPEGFRVVTKEAFFAALKAARRDIMPTTEQPEFTLWRVVETRQVWGWSNPGWRNPGAPRVFALRK